MRFNCQLVHHPLNCLNRKKAYAQECRLCVEACPHEAISEAKEIDQQKCSECGVCMAVCPSDGFVDRNSDNLFDYLEKTDPILLNCPQAKPAGFEIPCLGILDRELWLVLMLQARQKEVQIYTGLCSECLDRGACFNGVGAFREATANWPEHPSIAIIVSPDSDQNGPASAVNRRNATEAGDWKSRGREKLESLLPGITADESYPIPKSRQALLALLEANPDEKLSWPALTANDSCTSCGVCVAICPQGALSKQHEDSKFSLIYEPSKCIRCKRCVRTCRPGALSFKPKTLSHRLLTARILLYEGNQLHCEHCGKLLFERTEPLLCIACASNDANWTGR